MTIAAALIPHWLSITLWLGLIACCALAIRLADWSALRAFPQYTHLIFGGTLCSLILWTMSVTTVDGLWFHFLGVTSLTLLLGWRFAILAGTVAIVAHTLVIGQPLWATSSAWLLTVAVPATVSRWLVHGLRKSGSRNLFIYLLGAGFGGGLLSVLAMAITAIALLWLCGQDAWVAAAVSNWPLIFLVLFPEGFINGMIVTTLAVFFPQLLKTFDDRYYLEDG